MSRLRKVGLFGSAVTAVGAVTVSLVGGFEGLRLKAYIPVTGDVGGAVGSCAAAGIAVVSRAVSAVSSTKRMRVTTAPPASPVRRALTAPTG